MKSTHVVFFITFILLSTCYSFSQPYRYIKGNILGAAPGSSISIRNSANQLVDSTRLLQNSFQLKFNTDNANSLGSLTISNKHFSKTFDIFLGNENMSVEGIMIQDTFKLNVTGSPSHELMEKLRDQLADVEMERNDNLKKYSSLLNAGLITDSVRNAYWGQAGSIKMLDDEKLYRQKKFIFEHLNSFFSLYLLEKLKSKYSKTEMANILNSLDPFFKKNMNLYGTLHSD